ncbi:MAG: dienelactone hydrolase family protein [Candidatus Sedimenticola sp. (ex Thyasira tokunagai)]
MRSSLLKLIFFASVLFLTQVTTASAVEITTETIQYSADGATGFLAKPVEGGNLPAMILIHEWWGLNDNVRENARRFAAQGYVALAVDMYGGKVAQSRDQAKALAGAVRKDKKKAFANLNDALDYLRGEGGIVDPSRLASVGWCFGGGWSYQVAKNNLGVKSSVIYYGFFNPEDDLSIMRTTILGHFGEKDRSIKVDNAREFQAKLNTLGGDHEVYIYPNAGHAFANDSGKNYDQAAADLAWERTLAFLDGTLKRD